MKRNITINMCGRLFAIDEDAYEVLNAYERSLRSHFRGHEGGEEIANDLEERIAELMDELKAQGIEAVNIDHVQDIIRRLGNPQQMDGAEAPSEDEAEATAAAAEKADAVHKAMSQEGSAAKRLYRNKEDKKWMGVLSGFAAYFGGDVLWWRLGFAALFLISSLGIFEVFWPWWMWKVMTNICIVLGVIYLVLAVLMPVASTPEERLRMKGQAVTPENLAEEVTGGTRADSLRARGKRDDHLGCLGGFVSLLAFLLKIMLFILGAWLVVLGLGAIIALLAVLVVPSQVDLQALGMPEFFTTLIPARGLMMAAIVSAVATLFILLFALVYGLLRALGMRAVMGRWLTLLLVLLGLAGLVTTGVLATTLVLREAAAYETASREKAEKTRLEQIHDGVFIREKDWDCFQRNGWTLVSHDNCNDRYTSRGEHWSGEDDHRYLDSFDDQHRQRYTVKHTETLMPGTYRLTATGRANGTGAAIYLTDSIQGKTMLVPIPALGNEGGSIWEEAHLEQENLQADSLEVPRDLKRIAKVNNGRGYGWSRLTIGPFKLVKPTTVSYGVTTDPAITGCSWLGQWFSACCFRLELVE